MSARDDIPFWFDETWALPDNWQWSGSLGEFWQGFTFTPDPTLPPGTFAMGSKSELKKAKMLRKMRRIVQQERYPDDTPTLWPLPTIDVDFVPPPLTAVRADWLSRLWSRKS